MPLIPTETGSGKRGYGTDPARVWLCTLGSANSIIRCKDHSQVTDKISSSLATVTQLPSDGVGSEPTLDHSQVCPSHWSWILINQPTSLEMYRTLFRSIFPVKRKASEGFRKPSHCCYLMAKRFHSLWWWETRFCFVFFLHCKLTLYHPWTTFYSLQEYPYW